MLIMVTLTGPIFIKINFAEIFARFFTDPRKIFFACESFFILQFAKINTDNLKNIFINNLC